MIRPLVLVDLDDNLFQTHAKCPPETLGALVRASTARNGRHSHMTPAQKAFVDWLLASAEAVPVTARGTEAFRAVSIPFRAGAIVANGAVLLDAAGEPDAQWRDLMARELAPFQDDLANVTDAGRRTARRLNLSVRSWIVEEAGLGVYAVVKENGETGGEGLALLASALPVPSRWRVYRNGNNLAFLPPPVSKRRATAHLIARARAAEPRRPVIGLGDSLSDLDFLSLCDWWGAPKNSQIGREMAHLGLGFAVASDPPPADARAAS